MRFAFAPRIIGFTVLAVCFFTLEGCGSGGKTYVLGQVGGKVTLDDKPAQKGCVVVFHPLTGDGINQGIGVVRDDGTYSITSNNKPGLPVGDYQVSITPPPADPEEQKKADEKNSATIMTALTTRDASNVKKDLVYLQTGVVPLIYRAQGTRPLKATVKEGGNTVDLSMFEKPTGGK